VIEVNLSGEMLKNKLFLFGNLQYASEHEAANLNFPVDAAPLAVPYSTTTNFTRPNHYMRFDYQINNANQFKFSWLRERILTVRDSIEVDKAIPDAARHENDAGDMVYSWALTSLVNNRTTNELRVGHVRESLLQGPQALFAKTGSTSAFFDRSWQFVGFHGQEPFDIGSQNTHPDYIAGPRNTYAANYIRDLTFDDTLTHVVSGWHGEHNLKAGVSSSRNGALPAETAANFIGLFTFPTNAPFNAANPRTYPFRFGISMGEFAFREIDHRLGSYVQDKWEVTKRLTLNLGVGYDWQRAIPKTKDALGPRVGVARAGMSGPLALVTADLESHVVMVRLPDGASMGRIPTGPGPRSIESAPAGVAVVAHTQHGVVSLVDVPPGAVRKELDAFTEPRYTAVHPAGAIAYVTDSGNRQVVAVDLARGRVLARVDVPGPARHVSISPDGRALWTSLGSTARQLAVFDTSEPRRPRLVTTITPPFLAHDVVFSPDGRSVWVTSGSERRVALYGRESRRPARVIGAEARPQPVAFGRGEVFVASGDDGTVRRHRLDGELLSRARVPLDSYNVTFGWGSAVTPSLGRGTVSILDAGGRVRIVRRIAKAAHDACIVSTT